MEVTYIIKEKKGVLFEEILLLNFLENNHRGLNETYFTTLTYGTI